MLIVDDDPGIGLILKKYFENNGYDVSVAEDGRQALDRMQRSTANDIVLLDVVLPEKSGWDVLEEMQKEWTKTPVLMLSSRGGDESILKAFDLGATDYVVKPFNVEELGARVRAILQRTQPPSKAPMKVYQVGDVEVNFSTHKAHCNGVPVQFTRLELDIVRYLIENRGRIMSRQQLLRDVWDINQDIVTRTIDRHIASIRKKLRDDATTPEIIETIYGIGYRLNEEVLVLR
jgi:DNA-binding response OmpR family regulator